MMYDSRKTFCTGGISFFIDDRVPAAFPAVGDISAFGFVLQYAWGSDGGSVVLDDMENTKEKKISKINFLWFVLKNILYLS